MNKPGFINPGSTLNHTTGFPTEAIAKNWAVPSSEQRMDNIGPWVCDGSSVGADQMAGMLLWVKVKWWSTPDELSFQTSLNKGTPGEFS